MFRSGRLFFSFLFFFFFFCGVFGRGLTNPAAANMLALDWDTTLENTAQNWADQCVDSDGDGLIDHNPNRGNGYPLSVGENIYGTSGTTLDPVGATDYWQAEVQYYTYSSNTCAANEVCGHYTQLVWASTYRVGCASHDCPALKYQYGLVCDYAPAGNVDGEWPYQTGSGGIVTEGTTVPGTTGTTGSQTTGVQTTGVQTTGVQTTGVQTTGVQTTAVQTTGVQTTAVQTTGVQTTGVQTTGTTAASTTDMQGNTSSSEMSSSTTEGSSGTSNGDQIVSNNSSGNDSVIIGAAVGGGVVLLLILAAAIFVYRRRRRNSYVSSSYSSSFGNSKDSAPLTSLSSSSSSSFSPSSSSSYYPAQPESRTVPIITGGRPYIPGPGAAQTPSSSPLSASSLRSASPSPAPPPRSVSPPPAPRSVSPPPAPRSVSPPLAPRSVSPPPPRSPPSSSSLPRPKPPTPSSPSSRVNSPAQYALTPSHTAPGAPVPVSADKVKNTMKAPPPPSPKFSTGARVKAKYSADGAWYAATVKESAGGKYLVNYGPAFNNDEEWLPFSAVKE